MLPVFQSISEPSFKNFQVFLQNIWIGSFAGSGVNFFTHAFIFSTSQSFLQSSGQVFSLSAEHFFTASSSSFFIFSSLHSTYSSSPDFSHSFLALSKAFLCSSPHLAVTFSWHWVLRALQKSL